MARATLVAEEVSHWRKRALVSASLLAILELLLNEISKEFFCFNLGEFDVARELSVDKQLLSEEIRE